jgi:hypothetical protein
MEHESLDYKIMMDDGPDTEVLGRLASLDIASAAYLQAIVKYPLRNVQLRQGEQIIKRHDGEPKPEPPKDPNLKRWSAHLIGGKKMQLLGFVEAVTCGDRDCCRIVRARRPEAQAPRRQSPTLWLGATLHLQNHDRLPELLDTLLRPPSLPQPSRGRNTLMRPPQ